MVRRTVTAILWFFAVAWGWNLVAAMSGLPSATGLAIGLGAAALIMIGSPRVAPQVDRRSQAPSATDAGAASDALPEPA
jgi:hypothetical protein